MGSLLKTLVLKFWNGLEEEAGRTLPAAPACQSQLRAPTAGQALNYWAALPDVWLIFGESENEHERTIPATNEIFCQSGKNELNCHQTQFPVRIFWMKHSILICSRIPPKELIATEASCPFDFPLTVSQYQSREAVPMTVFLINIIITGDTCYHFHNSRGHITFVIFFMLMPCDNKK